MKIIALETSDGRSIASRVCIADRFHTRSVGLLRRTAMDKDEGLLLIPGGSVHTVGMRFPIDIVFLDRRMRVLNFARAVSPHRFCLAPSRTANVLELAPGRVAEVGLLIGHGVQIADDDDDPEVRRAHGRPGAAATCVRRPLQFSLRLVPQRCSSGSSSNASGAVGLAGVYDSEARR